MKPRYLTQLETKPYRWKSVIGLYRLGRLCGACGQLSAFNALTDYGWRCYKGNCCLATTAPDGKYNHADADKRALEIREQNERYNRLMGIMQGG